tara:strand:+ start:56 stop:649 length:594 start_codon:yes stop_codon:yes gene_type:complete
VPKKLTEIEKKKIIEGFMNGKTIDELSKEYNFTKITITRHLKKTINEEEFKNIVKRNNQNESNVNNVNSNENFEQIHRFVEITPLNLETDINNQKDLSSIPLSEIGLPKEVFMIVDKKIELETKFLRDYPDWQFLPKEDLNRMTIEIYFDMKIAKKFCSKEQKVIKVPNTSVFNLVAPFLVSRGISRIVCPDKLISL